MKIFEVILNDKPYTWKADENTKINKKAQTVTIEFTHPEQGVVKTVVNLAQVPVYTFG
jgi:hypothetical protein